MSEEFAKPGLALNISDQTVAFKIDRSAGQKPIRHVLEPGGTTQVDPGYLEGRERRGKRLPSIVEKLTKGKVVSAESEAGKAYLAKRGSSGDGEGAGATGTGDGSGGDGSDPFEVPAEGGESRGKGKGKR